MELTPWDFVFADFLSYVVPSARVYIEGGYIVVDCDNDRQASVAVGGFERSGLHGNLLPGIKGLRVYDQDELYVDTTTLSARRTWPD